MLGHLKPPMTDYRARVPRGYEHLIILCGKKTRARNLAAQSVSTLAEHIRVCAW